MCVWVLCFVSWICVVLKLNRINFLVLVAVYDWDRYLLMTWIEPAMFFGEEQLIGYNWWFLWEDCELRNWCVLSNLPILWCLFWLIWWTSSYMLKWPIVNWYYFQLLRCKCYSGLGLIKSQLHVREKNVGVRVTLTLSGSFKLAKDYVLN